MKVKIFNADDRVGEETYVDITQEQFDKFKAIEKQHKWGISEAPNAQELWSELEACRCQPDMPELIWYQ